MSAFLNQLRSGQKIFIREHAHRLHSSLGEDFTDCTFIECVFEDCDLEGGKFHGARIERTTFINSQLRICKFDGAALKQVVFKKSGLGQTLWRNTVLNEVNFEGSNLVAAKFSAARLLNIHIQGAWYNKYTSWPERDPNSFLGLGGFNPEKYGAVRVSDSSDQEWIVPGKA